MYTQNKLGRRGRKSLSIRARILIPVCMLLALQTAVLLGGVFLSGLLHNLDENSFAVLDERVASRARYLENEMVGRWSNLSGAEEGIARLYAEMAEEGTIAGDTLTQDAAQYNAFLTAAAPELIALMRANGVTGAFLVLNTEPIAEGAAGSLPGLYLRDRDPSSRYTAENGDLLLERAPMEVAGRLGIAMDSNWRPMFQLSPETHEDDAFILKPFNAAAAAPELTSADAGYWAPLHTLLGDNIAMISYSIPLTAPDGTLFGVLGVDILENHLEKLLPYAELSDNKGSAYVLGIGAPGQDVYRTVLTCGPVYALRNVPGITQTHALEGWTDMLSVEMQSGGEVYASRYAISLYNSNTPFAEEQWVLLGAVPREALFRLSHTTALTMLAVLAFILATSLAGILLIVHYVSRPIVGLAANVRATDPRAPARLPKTRITEVDALAGAIETLSSEVFGAADKFTQILQMASVRQGGFEIDEDSGALFFTNGFFDVFGRADLRAGVCDAQSFQAAMETLAPHLAEHTEQENGRREYVFRLHDGDPLWVRLRVQKTGARWAGLAEDITRDRLSMEKVEYERDHDVLTDLYNRRAFNRMAGELFADGGARLGVAALVMLDLDNLKYINDTYGHDLGDAYIRCAAQSLPGPEPEHCIVGRMSGDEFFVLLYGYTAKQEARAQLDALCQRLRRQTLTLPDGERHTVRASGGIAWYPEDADSFEQLLQYADFAMYKVKNSTKGEFAEFDSAVYRREAYLLQGREALHHLLTEQLVDYYFQPIVSVRTGEIFAYEALMRPRVEGIATPQAVLELARREGKLRAVETLTWNCALAAFEQHCREGRIGAQCRVFVNSLADQAMTPADHAAFERRFTAYLPRVVLELTELTQLDEELQMVKSAALARTGGRVALDDYGSGYNGEAMLLAVRPEYVKIDVAIVRGIHRDPDCQELVANLVSYARSRGIELVAEGVETAQEMEMLVHLGVDYMQGFYFARPALLPPDIAPGSRARLLGAKKKGARP